MDTEAVKCPKCGSTQIHVDKKGFSTGKAVIGTVVANPVIGALAGAAGSNKIIITCLKCGNQFNPGEQVKKENKSLPTGVNIHAAEKSDLYITCPNCQKLSSAECSVCPKCGRKFLQEDYETATKVECKPSGCLSVLLLGIVASSFLFFYIASCQIIHIAFF